jgi:hypothetical protein
MTAPVAPFGGSSNQKANRVPDPNNASRFSLADPMRISMWTVIGSVFASVLTAGILGGASGILQVPNLINQVALLTASRELENHSLSALSERTRSAELTLEGLQRQVNDIAARQNQFTVRLEKMDSEERTLDVATQREISELEGRSKDRSTQAIGLATNASTAISDLNERLKSTADGLNTLRAVVYDLSMRSGMRQNQSQQGSQQQSAPRSFGSPYDRQHDGGPFSKKRLEEDAAGPGVATAARASLKSEKHVMVVSQ